MPSSPSWSEPGNPKYGHNPLIPRYVGHFRKRPLVFAGDFETERPIDFSIVPLCAVAPPMWPFSQGIQMVRCSIRTMLLHFRSDTHGRPAPRPNGREIGTPPRHHDIRIPITNPIRASTSCMLSIIRRWDPKNAPPDRRIAFPIRTSPDRRRIFAKYCRPASRFLSAPLVLGHLELSVLENIISFLAVRNIAKTVFAPRLTPYADLSACS